MCWLFFSATRRQREHFESRTVCFITKAGEGLSQLPGKSVLRTSSKRPFCIRERSKLQNACQLQLLGKKICTEELPTGLECVSSPGGIKGVVKVWKLNTCRRCQFLNIYSLNVACFGIRLTCWWEKSARNRFANGPLILLLHY